MRDRTECSGAGGWSQLVKLLVSWNTRRVPLRYITETQTCQYYKYVPQSCSLDLIDVFICDKHSPDHIYQI